MVASIPSFENDSSPSTYIQGRFANLPPGKNLILNHLYALQVVIKLPVLQSEYIWAVLSFHMIQKMG